jgi:hypothetical protein
MLWAKGPFMKTTILIVAIVSCVALGILGFAQSNKLKAQGEELAQVKQQLAALEAELKEKDDAVEDAKLTAAKANMLQKTLSESASATAAESKKSEKLQQSLAEAKTNNPLRSMGAMFKDPKMREMMKAQQKAFMGPMLDKQYADLFKQLNMTPEQTAAFKDLLTKKMLAGADAGMSLFDDSMDATQRADLAKEIKSQTAEFDNQMKEFLGADNYEAYQKYEKTVPDRATTSQFSDQYAGTELALTPAQQEGLVQALSDSRNNYNWTSGLNQANPGANGDMASYLTPENIDKFVHEKEQFDQEFMARAQQILTPQQAAAYQQFQKTQRDLQVAGLRMAGQMFGAGK